MITSFENSIFFLQSLILCMESQFDMMILDRPSILQSLYHLHNMLCDRSILTWEFFINRFDTLFIEAQINFGKIEDINFFKGTLINMTINI